MKSENPLIYTRQFIVKGHDVNADRYITIPNLLKAMQECSLQHARKLKTSVWDMKEQQVSWVLLRKQLKIVEPMKLDERFTVITYPSGFEKFFAFRDYLVFNEEKKLVTAASSTWTLINTGTRKVSRIPEEIYNIGTPLELKFLTQASKKIKIVENMSHVDDRKVRQYDLDWNDHVSNLVLVKFMMESFKDKNVKDQNVKDLLIHFKNEAYLKDDIQVLFGASTNYFCSVLKSGDGKIVASSRVELKE